jgi:serine/threonine-protein kinase
MTDLLDRLRRALSDRYAIERELGRGGMAVVFLAEDLKHRRKVAIKVLSPDLSSDVGAERFLREIEIVAGLTHPHILPLHDSGQADDLLFCVMPYVEGESLRERLEREKQLPLEDAVQITREVAEALDYAHGCGIIHRDIKPANILLEHGHAVVADFGIARAVEQAAGTSITQTGLAMGTPAYMSPEQASGSDDVDGRADTYALGCVLYEMLSGETPFTGSTPQSVLAKKRSEPTPRVSVVRETVPPAVEAALTKSLAKTPADRFATAGQFAEALSARGEETEGKRPAWHWVAGLAAAVIITAIGAFVLQSGGPGRVPDASAGEVDRIVVAPFENRTGDPAAADWAFVAAEYIARGIDRAGEVTVVPARTGPRRSLAGRRHATSSPGAIRPQPVVYASTWILWTWRPGRC